MNDQELLQSSLERLRATGAIEYTGEFGNEITTFTPFAHWLKREGYLKDRKVVTYRGMRPYYYFLDDAEYDEKSEPRIFLEIPERTWPSNSSYSATKQPWHVMPDYRARYKDQGKTFDKPVLFIQNKFTVDSGIGPINFISLRQLGLLFGYADRFDIVYSRPRANITSGDYSNDHNIFCEYPDLALAKEFPQVTVLEDYCAQEGLPYNQTKLEMLAKSYLFATVQGGGAHLLACFDNSLILLLHRYGHEYPHSYAKGPYKYLSDPPPRLLVARSFADYADGVSLLGSAGLKNGRVTLDPKWAPTLRALTM